LGCQREEDAHCRVVLQHRVDEVIGDHAVDPIRDMYS
jgi:hypothetical protein